MTAVPTPAPTRRPAPGGARLWRWGVPAVALLGLVLYPIVQTDATYPQTVLLMAFLLGVQAVSWNILGGYTGYVSLGHSAFLGIGAYTTGILAEHAGWNPFWFAPVAGLAAVVVSAVVGWVVLRTRGHAFVIITIALLLSLQVLATNLSGITHGSDGITLALPFWSRDIQNVPFYYAFLGLLVAVVAFSGWLRRTKFGAGLVAIREDEGKAAAIGINTTRYKVLAFCASTFFIGAAGAVYAYFQTFVNPTGSFAILTSVTIVLACLAGGRGTLWGPVIGAFLVQLLNEEATVHGGSSDARVLVFGTTLVLVVLFLPRGLLPTIGGWWARRHSRETEYTDQTTALERRTLTVRVREPHREQGAALLDVRGATKRFGGITAVDGADLVVRRGSIAGLIGPNGSGKTTLFNLVTGTMSADAGEVWFDGERIDRQAPWDRGHLGIGRTFQTTRLFKTMTVLENVVAPMPDARWARLGHNAVSGDEADRARELLDFVGLGRFANQSAAALSYGQQKLVELAQVLMLEPDLILLDEPAGGINPSLVNRLVEIVQDLNRQGVTFLVVEHNIPMVLDLCDEITVFAHGKPIAAGPPAAIRNDPLVIEAYLGDDWSAPAAVGGATPASMPATSGAEAPARGGN